MSLSSLGRMLKSYFSRQQRRSRNRQSPILDPLKTLPRKGEKKDFYRKGNGSWFTFGAGEENAYRMVGFCSIENSSLTNDEGGK